MAIAFCRCFDDRVTRETMLTPLLQLIRPDFQAFMESEQRTLALVTDVANTLESVAVNSSHTPALYSTFLRAVVTARTAGPSQPPSPRGNASQGPTDVPLATQPQSNNANSPLDVQFASNPAAGVFGDEHQFGDGALGLKMFPPANGTNTDTLSAGNGTAAGPGSAGARGTTSGAELMWGTHVNGSATGGELDLQATMSSFQLPNPPQGDDFSSMSMDNILSGGFWDNVLIPGMSQSWFCLGRYCERRLVFICALFFSRLFKQRIGGS